MRALFVVIFVLSSLAPGAAQAEAVSGLYTAAPSVTGTGEAERLRGFRLALEDVLIKLTGDAGLAGSAAAQQIIARAPDFVASYSYEDEMKGIPIHDEQGTRDRPHRLTVTFDAGKLGENLRGLGFKLWPGDRPRTAVLLGIKDMRAAYVLRAQGEEAYGQREVIKHVARQRGLPVILPVEPAALGLSYDVLANGETPAIAAAARALGADAVIYGVLNFDGQGYWNMDLTLLWWGHDQQNWSQRGVTFDIALRQALERVAKIFSAAAAR